MKQAKPRFMIDHSESCNGSFGLYRKMLLPSFFWGKPESAWFRLASFKTREEARAEYEAIKDLPEYLD